MGEVDLGTLTEGEVGEVLGVGGGVERLVVDDVLLAAGGVVSSRILVKVRAPVLSTVTRSSSTFSAVRVPSTISFRGQWPSENRE
ncbi:hypothetical protein GCM10010343_12570 [Streptomyces avidinii]|nr:hypothetical protein GCM10010343_12570 [Streptomyces avidinii]